MNRDTEVGGAYRSFPSTSWSILNRLRDGASSNTQALHRLVDAYWKPVYCLIRYSWHKNVEDSKDLTQEFFMKMVLEGELIQKFAPERGSFRSFLKASIINFMRDQTKTAQRAKRGGDAKIIPIQISDFDLSEILPDSATLTPDQVFDAAWKHVVINKAVAMLRDRLLAQGKEPYYEVFRRYEVERKDPSLSYKTLADEMGLEEQTVKKHLEYARNEFRKAVLAVVADYVDNDSDFSAEMRDLFGG